MRGKRCAGLSPLLLSAALLGAGPAAAENAPSPTQPATIVVLDASSSMNTKIGSASKITSVKTELGAALGTYAGRLSFGLVALGHRKASNCADSEILAKPGELTFAAKDKFFDKIKPKGQAPIAAALSDAAKAQVKDRSLDIVLIADGGDTCDADICSTAAAMKEKSQALRIHVVGYSAKADDLKPLACLSGVTGGTFVAATNADELKQGLTTVLDAVANPASAAAPQAVAAVESPAPPALGALPGVASAVPMIIEAAPETPAAPQPQAEPTPQAVEPQASEAAGETAVLKSAAPPLGETPSQVSDAPPVRKVHSVAIAPPPPPPQAALPTPPPTAELTPPVPTLAPKPAQTVAVQVQLPVPVTFKALVTEQGPKLQAGLTWRVFASKTSPDGHGYQLLSTHREAMPTAALLPGEYLVNAAYGLSNLTKKIKVESGRSLEETFVLNTGGLKLSAALASGEAAPEGAVKFDILSDDEDQRGNRHMILDNAKPGLVVRLNAGAYRIESLYGDANAIVRADVTVEPGKITEATIKQTGSKTTFKLVQTLGGEALADTKWTILTSAGDVVKENAGALPTHILSPGSYAVVADHGGLSYTRKFSIEPGDTKQIEVVVDDGPTSAEDLKALTDPPEPPPVPASAGGMVAGDGQAPSPGAGVGFDGFSASAPADPNAPLINPGILLRPSR